MTTRAEDTADALADLCDEGADIILNQIQMADPASSDAPPSVLDERVWKIELGSVDPGAWIQEIGASYLTESGHIIRAIARLLRTRAVFASMDPLVRAVVERVGRVNWILDFRINHRQRAIRAGLEIAVSWQFYRSGIARLEGDKAIRKVLKAPAAAHLERLESWFEPVKPPENPCDILKLTSDVSQWIFEGEVFPTMTRLAQYALESAHFEPGIAAGVYDALSGFAHPSVITSRENRRTDERGAVQYFFRAIEMDKLVRLALLSYFDGVNRWVDYFGAPNRVEIKASMDSISRQFDELSAQIPEIEPDQLP